MIKTPLVLDSNGNIEQLQLGDSLAGTVPNLVGNLLIQSVDEIINSNYSVILSNKYIINNSNRLTISAGGRLKII